MARLKHILIKLVEIAFQIPEKENNENAKKDESNSHYSTDFTAESESISENIEFIFKSTRERKLVLNKVMELSELYGKIDSSSLIVELPDIITIIEQYKDDDINSETYPFYEFRYSFHFDIAKLKSRLKKISGDDEIKKNLECAYKVKRDEILGFLKSGDFSNIAFAIDDIDRYIRLGGL